MKKIIVIILAYIIMIIIGPYTAYALDNTFTAGGTNYVIYKAEAVAGNEDGWVISNNPDFAVMTSQMNEFCRAGQKKIALTLYFTSSGLDKEDRTYGANSSGGTLPVWTSNTIIEIIHRVIDQKDPNGSHCFNELQFRFRPLGRVYTDPKEWDEWNEAGYLDNKSFIFQTRELVKTTIGNAPISVYFDLGVEQGGEIVKQNEQYVKRLWKDYTDSFGADDTYGFSIAWDPGKLIKLVAVYDMAGVRPSQYAVDVYEAGNLPESMDILQQLKDIDAEMRQTGEQNKPILIQETYYNDQKTLDAIHKAISLGINIRTVMQWQVNREMQSIIGPSYIYVPQYKTSDLNADGHVDIFDYNLLVGNFGKTGTDIIGDLDNNGNVDGRDYDELVNNFGK